MSDLLTTQNMEDCDKALQVLFGVSFAELRAYHKACRAKGHTPTEFELKPLDLTIAGMKIKVTP